MKTRAQGRKELVWIPLAQLIPHPLNANVMAPELKEKLARHIARSGRYPPLIVRQLRDGTHQILDGHQRVEVLGELGEEGAWCLVWEISDEEALILLGTLNRLEGQDVPGRRAALIAELEAHHSLAALAELLPEDEAQLESALQLLDVDVDALVAKLTEEAKRVAAEGPQLFSFAVPPYDAPAVEAAIELAGAQLSGHNRRGRALAIMARSFLPSRSADQEHPDA